MDTATEQILRRRMHGLYLSRQCEKITTLAQELLGMHCWFHRNVVFSSLIRGANPAGWKTALTKTWLYRGTLHGVERKDLPTLLALHGGDWRWGEPYREIAEKAMLLMEDGVYSRAEMRRIFREEYDAGTVEHAFSSWGGIFCELARMGKVAFRDMTSRDFTLIDAEPRQTAAEVLPGLFRRYLAAYGPATIDDAAWFFGLNKDRKQELNNLDLNEYSRFEQNKNIYYFIGEEQETGEIPELTLLSGFDPLIVSYADRSAVLPSEYKRAVILSSGICLPTVAVNGQVAGLWNIKKGEPTLEFFTAQPKKIRNTALEMIDKIRFQSERV